MKKNNAFVLFYFLMISLSCQGMETTKKLVRTPSFKKLAKEIDESIEQTNDHSRILVIFNIDALFNRIPLWTMQEIIKQKYSERKEKINTFYSLIDKNFKPPLTDERMPHYITKLQKKNPSVKIIGLTESRFGSRPFKRSYEDAMIKTLKSYDLNFSEAFVEHGDYVLYNCVINRDETGYFKAAKIPNDFFPINRYYNTKLSFLFKKGILFTNGFSKDCVLKEFLNRIKKTDKWKPDGVIFIDDAKEKSLALVKNLLADNDIPHKLIYDTRIDDELMRIRKSREAQKKAHIEACNYIEKILIRHKKQKPTKA